MILGLGTAALGRPEYINIRQEEKEPFNYKRFKGSGVRVLDEAYDAGIRYFDTAPGYGLAEELLLEWVKDKKDVELATKWGYTYVADFNPDAQQHEIKEHSLDKLSEQWEYSKQLLPYLSTYQIHSATLETGVLENEKVLSRLAQLKTDFGLKIGLTTTGVNQEQVLRKALKIKINGEPLFTVFQVTCNVLEQSLIDILPEIILAGHRVVIKEAMANGRLLKNEAYPHYSQLYLELDKLAFKYNVGVDAIAMRFLQDTMKPFSILSGGSTVEHVHSNLKTTGFNLNSREIEKLTKFKVKPSDYWKERKELSWQ